MPCLRGLEVFITVAGEAGGRRLEEYPHPEGSSATVSEPAVSAAEEGGRSAKWKGKQPETAASPKEDSSQDADARISVYIASQPRMYLPVSICFPHVLLRRAL
jgi:hypothetical protein